MERVSPDITEKEVFEVTGKTASIRNDEASVTVRVEHHIPDIHIDVACTPAVLTYKGEDIDLCAVFTELLLHDNEFLFFYQRIYPEVIAVRFMAFI